MQKLFSGLSYNRFGWRYFFAHRELWKYAVIPVMLNVFAAGVVAFFFVRHAGAAFAYLTHPLESFRVADPVGLFQHAASLAVWAARTFLTAFIFIVGLALTAACLYVFGMVLCGPFYESLSERVLVLTGERTDAPFQLASFASASWHCLKTECAKAAFFACVSAALFLLGWIPVVGLIFSALQLIFSAWFFAFGISTYPLVLERAAFARLLTWGWNNAARLVGFGLPSLIPFAGVLFGPFQVVGATLLYVDRKSARETHPS